MATWFPTGKAYPPKRNNDIRMKAALPTVPCEPPCRAIIMSNARKFRAAVTNETKFEKLTSCYAVSLPEKAR
ncbi:hypothetical protein D3C75_182550 [compost metagenome]